MLVKQGVDISFAEGLDTKTDPKRVQMGKFLQLENSVFNKGGLLQKRNGYKTIATVSSDYSYLTTFNDNLTAIGQNIGAFNSGNNSVITKGSIQPLSESTLALLRNNLNQTMCDSVIAANGLICTVYLESNGTTTTAKYVIADSVTGQNIVAPTVIPVASGDVTGSPRVFYLGNDFVIVFTNVITAVSHLQYVTVNAYNPTTVGANTDIAASYIPASTVAWDGFVVDSKLFIAYNTTSGGQSIKVTYLNTSGIIATPTTFSTYAATMMSVTADVTDSANVTIYLSFYNSGSSVGIVAAVDTNLHIVLAPVEIIAALTVKNITSAAQNGTCSVFYEVNNNYSYNSAIPTHYINCITISIAVTFNSVFASGDASIVASSGTGIFQNGMFIVDNTTPANLSGGRTIISVASLTLGLSSNTSGNSASSPGDFLVAGNRGTPYTVIRSVGLASKAFIVNEVIYFLSSYQSPYQDTYFLINGSTSVEASPVVAGKLAYENGGGYLTIGLPSVSIDDSTASLAYLFKDLIQAVNKDTNVASGTQTAGIYSQTGINLAMFTFGTSKIDAVQIGGDLHISGGFLWMYDGYLPVEHNFFLYPDSIKVATQADPAPTGDVTNTSATITNLSSVAGIVPGMIVSGTGIPVGTTILSVGTTTAEMSAAATSSHSTITITFTGSQSNQIYFYQVTYEWSDNQGNQFKSAPSIPVTVTTTAGNSSVVLNIPTLRLTMKTANPIKIVIYRWSVAQQNYYQVTSITTPLLNSTTTDSVSYTDVFSDATILGNNLIYTTGGVVEDINAPASNIFALFDSRFWLVNAEDPNQLWFSKQVIENTPVEMSDVFTIFVPPTVSVQSATGPITALAAMDDKLIIFKNEAIYYINGTGPDNTGANNQYSQTVFITGTVGCANQKSIVLMPQGLMFQSDKGIWLLGRDLSTNYIGAPVERFNSSLVNSAVSIPATNQIRFTLDTGESLMYDYFYGQWGTFTGVPAVSSCIYQNLHTFINDEGLIYQEQVGVYLDGGNPVLMMFETGPLRLGDLQNYQRAYFFYILGTYISPHKLYLNISYDYEVSPSQSVIISPINYSTPYGSGESQSPYGQGTPYGGPSNLENWRIFLQRQRCMAFAIKMQEIFDNSIGTTAGAGLTLSGLNIVMGFKQKFRPQEAQTSVG